MRIAIALPIICSAFLVLPAVNGQEKDPPKEEKKTTAPVDASNTILEGTRWTVKVSPDKAATAKGEKEFNDTLVFAANKVSMTECTTKGYKPSSYTVRKSGADGWKFTTDQVSETDGKTVWNADIQGTTIKGTVVCTKKDGTILNYTFDGKKDVAADAMGKKPEGEKKKEEPKKEETKKEEGKSKV